MEVIMQAPLAFVVGLVVGVLSCVAAFLILLVF
jgi:hypothetical protein